MCSFLFCHTYIGDFHRTHINVYGCNAILAEFALAHSNVSLFSLYVLGVIHYAGGCFTKVSRALQNNLSKKHNTRNHIYGENFKLKLCACAQSMALGTRTKFQLEICITSLISAIHKFRENILESSRNVSETTPWALRGTKS